MKKLSIALLSTILAVSNTYDINHCLKQLPEQLSTLTLANCDLKDSDMNDLGEILNKNSVLQLDLAGNEDLTAEGLKTLSSYRGAKKVNDLNLSDTYINIDGYEQLSNFTSLHTLTADNSHINDITAITIAKNKTIKNFNLANNQIDFVSATAFAMNKNITKLDLNNNAINDEGAGILATSQSINTLILDNNYITATGAQALANNNTLTSLSLDNNYICNTGAIALANNKSILGINISNNNIGDEAAFEFAKTKTLKMLWIERNHLTSTGIAALKANHHIKVLVTDKRLPRQHK